MARTNIGSRWTPELTISKDPVNQENHTNLLGADLTSSDIT
jgi:hypothetical protein